MKKIKKLTLNKEVVSILGGNEMNMVKGGTYAGWFTGGCSDGCTGSQFLCTMLNCTQQDCTADCHTDNPCTGY